MVADPVFLQSIAFFGAAMLGLVIAVVTALAVWGATSDERPLLLSELLALEGVDMGARVKGAGARQFALAARACMRCAAHERCADWLCGEGHAGYQAFCPNAGYIERMKNWRE
jgi:hypothetical protein